jgi:CRISPR-associated endonuclease/helicase Cas3
MMISQEIVYAKSEPRQTIKEHTDALLNNLCLLKKTYGKQIDNLITKEYKDVFWNVLSLVIQYHDLGKINTNFQNKIRQKIGLTSLTTGIEREIPHNFLSPSFFGEEILRYEKDIIKVIIQSIVFHHEYKNLPEFKMIEETIKEDLEERKYLLSPLIKLPSTLWTGYEGITIRE